MKEEFCYDITHNLGINHINGEVKIGPCCQSEKISVDESTIDEYWNNKTLIKLREENKKNKFAYEFCKSCIDQEKHKLSSRRLTIKSFYETQKILNNNLLGLDIQQGNLCNLKCTICGPESSTSWYNDAIKLKIPLLPTYKYDKEKQFNLDNSTVTKDLQIIKFWGGEPLIDDKHYNILKKFEEQNILSQLRIQYQTNGTHIVSKEVLELWSKARLVEIYFSIDDIGERFNYQRFGADWNDVENNLKWFIQHMPYNHLFYINCTVSLLNICNLKNLEYWKQNFFNENRLGDEIKLLYQPVVGIFDIKSVNSYTFDKIKSNLTDQTISFSNQYQINEDKELSKIFDYLDKLDAIRNTNWRNTFPELVEIYNSIL